MGYKSNSNKTITLDGEYIIDIPSFYLSIGEAINGENGYFGACLDSLSDCLSGGFGLEYLAELLIINGESVEAYLNDSACLRFNLEQRLSAFEDDYTPSYESLEEMGVTSEINLKGLSFFSQMEEVFDGTLKLYA